jgi:death on curing protein
MRESEYLDLDDILGLVRLLKIGPVKDVGLLDSAVARPRSCAFGEDAYPTVNLKAAALLHSLTNNHALVDGNKRLAWLATVVFLDLNGCSPDLTDDEAFELVWEVAATPLTVEDIAPRIRLPD